MIGYVAIVNDISQKRKLGKSIPEYEDTEKVLINAFTESDILIDREGVFSQGENKNDQRKDQKENPKQIDNSFSSAS